jgi:UDP-glucose 4-epimerase
MHKSGNIMNLRVAVLGAGFIGNNFIRHCLHSGLGISVLDHKPCPTDLQGKLNWTRGDIANHDDVTRVIRGSEVVYHFVSSTVPGDQVDEGGELIQNVVETLSLLKTCVSEKVKRIVFISSASVYGIKTVLPVAETAGTDPISSHGIHKLTIEKYLQLYQYQHGLDCKIVRLSNPYGPGQNIHGRQGFIAIAIGKLLSGAPIVVRGDGSAVRDFVYIEDVCDVLALLRTAEPAESVFNVGSGRGISLKQVLSTIESILGRQIEIAYTGTRFVDIPASVLDISRERELLGKSAKVSLEEGIGRTLEYHGLR